MTATRPAKLFLFEPIADNMICNLVDFGECVEIFNKAKKRPSIYHYDVIEKSILENLDDHNYDPNIDFIVIANGNVTGLIHLVATVCSVYGKVKAVIWRKFDERYDATTIGFDIVEEKANGEKTKN